MSKVFTFATLSVLCANAQSISARAGTRFDRGVSTASSRGPITATVRSLDADVTYVNGKSALGYVAILYEPSSRAYLWMYREVAPAKVATGERPHLRHPNEFMRGWTAVISDQRIVLFSADAFGVSVLESPPEAATDLGDAERRAFLAARSQLRLLAVGGGPIPIRPRIELPKEFSFPPFSPMPKSMKLSSVTRVGTTWELVLECQWREKVVLDDRYRMVSHQKLP